jgi:NAD(P)H dehydrogenase (quinone)
MKVAITAATGRLGNYVMSHILKKLPSSEIVAVVRNPQKAAPFANLGVEIRYGNYNEPASLEKAFVGISRLLLISSSDAHDETLRWVQHGNVLKAAKGAGVGHVCYTGTAFPENAAFGPALLHLATEYGIRASKLTYTMLRDTLYTDDFINQGVIRQAIETGVIITNAGNGRLNSVTRNDFGRAHAAVLASSGHENKTYNLVSIHPWTMDELAQAISKAANKTIVHKSGTQEEVKNFLLKSGFDEAFATRRLAVYSQIAAGEWAKTSDDLRMLIGEETPLEQSIQSVLSRS